jgi:hypothetical protein
VNVPDVVDMKRTLVSVAEPAAPSTFGDGPLSPATPPLRMKIPFVVHSSKKSILSISALFVLSVVVVVSVDAYVYVDLTLI